MNTHHISADTHELPHPPEQEKPRKALFANRPKAYPKWIVGRFRRMKWAVMALLLGLYYLAPWLRWDRGPGAPDQAILVDMPGRRLYFFFLEIWPQEVYYLTGVLILAAVGLFLATSLLGRVWCGFTCPQTVWTDLFLMVERFVEGDRAQRIRLDNGPLTLNKIARKVTKHLIWLAIAVATGGAWIFYFNDAPTLMGDILRFDISPTILFFVGLFTATTYLLAGIVREQVCVYMCPWPRFQAAMLDEHSTTVTYQAWRGEQRGPKRKTESWEGRGDCIDCNQCVQVCPTGIDIRDGQQLDCIGCGLCIDACNEVMTKIGRPGELITFDTQMNQTARAAGQPTSGLHIFRPRTLIYLAVLAIVGGVMLASLMSRSDADLSVQRDRVPLFVQLGNGRIQNSYTLKILNKERADRSFEMTIPALPQAELSLVGHEEEAGQAATLTVKPDSVGSYRIHVRMPREALQGASTPVSFLLRDATTGESYSIDTVFLGPK
ncbi:cytochrome c oxidase accessory protein CcoG [Oceanibaculum indicum]|uniref:Nitrogen fixation protein fixG n=1 Tax=Oceanibaculum indicum P24 TaxID=1207063 RepID=K2J6N6_9PROT|nr:cytochrome c oxidase accessory protein CcoG [Oceanibaculum indicum]EKE78711.1 nitrogen fixation protein fixG [Oceanibaculum indicum P24]